MRAESAGLPVVLQVHDEIGAEVPEDQAESALVQLQQAMKTRPPWAPEMALSAEGYIAKFYTKD